MLKNVHIAHTGCSRLVLDTERIRRFLKVNKFNIVDKVNRADIIYVGTCGFTGYAEKNSLSLIRRMRRKNQFATIVIGGCLPAINENSLSVFTDDHCVILKDIENIADVLGCKSILPTEFSHFDSQPYFDSENTPEHFWLRIKRYFFEYGLSAAVYKMFLFFKDRKMSEKAKKICLIEISKGCLGKCTYCAVKFARGSLASRPLRDIVEEFNYQLSQGYSAFHLMAGDCGCYGMDINTNLVALLKEIFNIKKNFRITITDLNVRWLITYYKELIPILEKNRRRIDLIFMSVQSGSSRILRLMKREYVRKELEECLLTIKRALPDVSLGASFIVGFPTETEEDFSETKSLIKKLCLDRIIVFKYSNRPGTVAAKMNGQVDEKSKKKRMCTLELVQIIIFIRERLKVFSRTIASFINKQTKSDNRETHESAN